MTVKRTFIGLGEAMWIQEASGVRPGGLACRTGILAAQLGHEALAISRLGQDQQGDQLERALREAGVDVSCLQRDPDLATARLTRRSIGGVVTNRLDPRAAFDNMQWDFDLGEAARRADVIVHGLLARRYGQSKSTIDRVLAEGATALRFCDLTNRADGAVDRALCSSSLRLAEAAAVDRAALDALVPAHRGEEAHVAAVELMREHRLAFVIVVEQGAGVSLHQQQGKWMMANGAADRSDAAIVGVLHALLNEQQPADAARTAEAFAQHVASNPGEPAPARIRG